MRSRIVALAGAGALVPAAAATGPAHAADGAKLSSGGNYTAVAHLEEGGDPTATLFENDISKTAAGEGRLTAPFAAGLAGLTLLAAALVARRRLISVRASR